jgi:hypothetical protein
MSGHDAVAEGWHKSSTSNDVNCVEVRTGPEHVNVRNTRNRRGAMLTFTHEEWRAFVSGVRLGEFDVPEAPAT